MDEDDFGLNLDALLNVLSQLDKYIASEDRFKAMELLENFKAELNAIKDDEGEIARD